MTRRIVTGDIFGDQSVYGMRVSAPGFDVVTEPDNSINIPFDTRYSALGNVVAAGIAQCGGPAINFPVMSDVPVCSIFGWNGTTLKSSFGIDLSGPNAVHAWIPVVAIVDNSSIQIIPFTTPYYNTLAYYNPTGLFYAFYIFGN